VFTLIFANYREEHSLTNLLITILNLIKKIKNWEQWPFKILYAPIVPVWIWYMIRSRSVWFFTPSNPKLTFGGMEGEPKKEMHDLLPAEFCPRFFNVKPAADFTEVKEHLAQSGIAYPLIVKPEVGGQGILFRKIENEEHLEEYHRKVPVEYFIQEFIRYPLEVSLFYYRYPNEKKGNITGFLQKVPMRVTGDGEHTLEELLLAGEKTSKRMAELKSRHEASLGTIIPKGEIYVLSHAANHNRGARFIDLSAGITRELTGVLDNLSHRINDFYYGRYDIMCGSLEDLERGKNFLILEYNGCGAEPNHFYDTGYSLGGAWKEILMHWKILYRISRYNHRQGIAYWSFMEGLRFRKETKKHYKLIIKADQEIS
jgi:hypothetical protein